MAACIKEIWEEFSIPLKEFIKKRIPKEQDTDDILQEVFIKIHRSIGTLKDNDKIHAWIYMITRNTITDYYRRRNKSIKETYLREDLIEEKDEDLSSNKEIGLCLKTMVSNLPDKYKEAIILTEFENLTQRELSEKMGLSISGAKSRVQRARKKLKEMLLECCSLEFDRRGNVIDYRPNCKENKYC